MLFGLFLYQGKALKKVYIAEAKKAHNTIFNEELLTENDLEFLPLLVKKYLHYCKVVNKPKIYNFRANISGKIRKNSNSSWITFKAIQFSLFIEPKRFFYMKGYLKQLPVSGYQVFDKNNAYIEMRILSIFRVLFSSGKEMAISETVTFFNDMCCLAPATLIDARIKWVEANTKEVKAIFTNQGISITASLYFNELGQLVNFKSTDRYAATQNKTLKKIDWSTPIKEYKEINGINLPSKVDVIYHYPNESVCYANFDLNAIAYNFYE